jgi:hypothetical protein
MSSQSRKSNEVKKKRASSAGIHSTSTAGGANSTSTEDPHSAAHSTTAQDTQTKEFKLRRGVVNDNRKLSTTDILLAVPHYKIFENVRILGGCACIGAVSLHYIFYCFHYFRFMLILF